MASTRKPKTYRLRTLIAGGGVAGLEVLIGLRALAGDLVDLELLAPEPSFWYRPLAVTEPFDAGSTYHRELAHIAESVSAGFTLGELASVDTAARIARTSHGSAIAYDALVIACGALPRPAIADALTFRGPADSDAFRRVLDEARAGRVRSIAFALPRLGGWPLPLYELALLTAEALERDGVAVELSLVTPEPSPLSLFGTAASDAVRAMLADRGIALYTDSSPVRYHDGVLEFVPDGTVAAERVVALPRLEGMRILGIPQNDDGFVATDLSGRVRGLEDVYAAGDITDYPVKQGGIATQQADVVAAAIAARAGAAVQPRRFEPVLRGLLLTGHGPRYLRSKLGGGEEGPGTITPEPLWWPPAKIVGRHLAPFLAEQIGAEQLSADRQAGALEVEIELPPN